MDAGLYPYSKYYLQDVKMQQVDILKSFLYNRPKWHDEAINLLELDITTEKAISLQ